MKPSALAVAVLAAAVAVPGPVPAGATGAPENRRSSRCRHPTKGRQTREDRAAYRKERAARVKREKAARKAGRKT